MFILATVTSLYCLLYLADSQIYIEINVIQFLVSITWFKFIILEETGIALWYTLCYGLDDRVLGVPVVAGNFYPHHRVKTGSGTQTVSYPVGTRSSFCGGKAAGGEDDL
jgi:hypothetical protein